MTEHELAEMLQDNPDLSIEGDLNYSRNSNSSAPQPKPKAHLPKLNEHQLQAAIFGKFDERAVLRAEYSLIFAIPNGGHRHPAVAAKLKAEGVKAGVLDFMIPVARHGYHGSFVELKVGYNKPSQVQDEWIRNLTAEGYLCKVFWDSVDKTVSFVEWYLEGSS